MNVEIGFDSIIQRMPNLLYSEIEGEIVMLHIENSEYYSMDKIGSRIWQLIENPLKFKDLVHILIEEYDVNKQQCIEDTKVFLDILFDKNLLLVK